jgi:hypothetical protein
MRMKPPCLSHHAGERADAASVSREARADAEGLRPCRQGENQGHRRGHNSGPTAPPTVGGIGWRAHLLAILRAPRGPREGVARPQVTRPPSILTCRAFARRTRPRRTRPERGLRTGHGAAGTRAVWRGARLWARCSQPSSPRGNAWRGARQDVDRVAPSPVGRNHATTANFGPARTTRYHPASRAHRHSQVRKGPGRDAWAVACGGPSRPPPHQQSTAP